MPFSAQGPFTWSERQSADEAAAGEALSAIGERHGASPSQIALAWLLARSRVILPIPGTSSLAHLEENWEARRIALSPQEMMAIGG